MKIMKIAVAEPGEHLSDLKDRAVADGFSYILHNNTLYKLNLTWELVS